MDERSPRQPDSSGPPEDSGETGVPEARPQNPYRIPHRPPEDEREEAGGPDRGHRPPAAESDARTWDNPFRDGSLAEDWNDVELNTPWGAPVPGEEPMTDAFGAVGGSGHTGDTGSGNGSEGHDGVRGAESGREGPGTSAFDTTDPPDHRDDRDTWGRDEPAHDDRARDTWGQQGEDHWRSGPGTGAFGTVSIPGNDRPEHRHEPTRDDGRAWDDWGHRSDDHWGPTPGTGAFDTTDPPDHRDDRDAWGRDEPAHDDRARDTWNEENGDRRNPGPGTGASGTVSTPDRAEPPYGTARDEEDHARDTWGDGHRGPEPGPAWGAAAASGTSGVAGHEVTGFHPWEEPDRGGGSAVYGREGSGPGTGPFASRAPDHTGVPDHGGAEHQHGAAHGWGSWNEESERRGPAQSAASGGAAGPAAWDDGYGESGGTEFYGGAHDGGRDWDEPYRDRPAYEDDTPYPGVSAGPARSDDHEYMYGGGRGGDGGDDDGHGYAPGPDPEPGGRKSRKGLLIGLGAGVLVLALVGGGVGWYVWNMPEPQEATAAFASSWEDQDYEALAETTTGDDAAEVLGGIDDGLGVDAISVDVGEPVVDGGEGSASYEVTVSLTNADDWGWEGELPLVREDGQWWIDFSPEVAYPGLGEGQVLARTAVWGERGHILAADGTRLDSPETAGSLQMIAGSLGEADEDDIERLGPAYSVGDTIGVDGLQRTYEEHLAGEAATTIVMADAEEARGEGSVEATEDNTVATLDGSDGEDIVTSIDMDVQNTAANAIIDADDPAGLVALRPSTGEILAAVNVPGGFNRAFEGQYPPGSSFKVVSYSALLDNGMSTDETMDCPEEYELGGWPFRNAGGAEYGSQSVTEAFATSCNTALVAELGDRLSGEQLQASAEQFGMNQPLEIGVTTHEPVFPAIDSATALGSQGIGQGQILTSPLHMATVPAAIADGSWRHPVLVSEPEPEDLPEPTPIANAEAIRPMMRAVITEGTAEDIDFNGEVFGKTGTAEFGTAEDADDDDELPSHAWMVGYKGDVAFALVVEGGGGGSAVAGPLAADFTNGLP